MLCLFYCAAAMQPQFCNEQSFCLSVRPSVKHVNCDKEKETSAHILMPYDTKNGWWRCPLLSEILGQIDPPLENHPFPLDFSLVAP